MAKWKSKAQLEQEANEDAKRQVIAAVKEQVAQLVATWEASEYPSASACEKAIGDIIRAQGILETLPKALQYNGRILAENHFMQSGISKALRDRARQQEKIRQEAFKVASASRSVVEKGMFSSSMTPGEIVIIGSKLDLDQRVLTCLACDFIRAPRDMGQDDDGYYCTLAEPTDEEKATEAYQRAAKKVADDLADEQEKRQRLEARRQADLDAIRASGREPDFLDEFFAGTNDN
jgi:hypothetical protein